MAKTCFVVGPIGTEGSETRKRSDALLEYIIKKVLEPAPFQMAVDRADEIQKPGLITQQVIERVVNADLVVADLTDQNPNVFYELALRHATRKPVVHLVLSGQSIPFDIAHQRTIYYDTTNLATAEKAKEELRMQSEVALKGADAGDNPISAALVVLDLAQSKNTTDQSLARILKEITDLRESVRIVERAVAGRGLGFGAEGLLSGELDKRLQPPVGDLPQTNKVRAAALNLDPEVLRRIGEVMSASGLLKLYSQGAAEGAGAVSTICATCGQPIVGSVGRRSADNAPIHWEGKCPPKPAPPQGTPSS